MVTRFILSDGNVMYPNFLLPEEKAVLRERMGKEQLRMRCGCRDDVMLLYGVSADSRIYPLHQGYEHAAFCSRHQTEERNTPFLYEEDGKTTVFLTFNPKVFTPAYTKAKQERQDNAEDYVNEQDDDTVSLPESGEGRKKEMLPCCNLWRLVLQINRDTYSERITNGKSGILSEDYFKTAVLAHCKKVFPSGMSKSLRALSLEEDRVSFVYGKIAKCETSAVYIIGTEGRAYRRFVPENVMLQADKIFEKAYGMSIVACMEEGIPIYISGFVYKKVSRKGQIYTCFGRLVFFIVSKNGLMCESMLERSVLDKVLSHTRKCGGTFIFPDSDKTDYFGIFRIAVQRKEGHIYLKKAPLKDEGAVLCVSEEPTDEQIKKFVEDICF